MVLIAVYVSAMGLIYSAQFQFATSELERTGWYQLAGPGDFFQHTLPAEQGVHFRIQTAGQPSTIHKIQAAAIQFAQAQYFNSFFSRYFIKRLNLCIEQKQTSLLYPFHSFF